MSPGLKPLDVAFKAGDIVAKVNIIVKQRLILCKQRLNFRNAETSFSVPEQRR